LNSEVRKLLIDVDALGNAIVKYDDVSDTLYIVLKNEEEEESLLLPNDIVIRIAKGEIISITIRNVIGRQQ